MIFMIYRCAGRVRPAALCLGGVRLPEVARGSRAVDCCNLVDPSRGDDRARLVLQRLLWPLRRFRAARGPHAVLGRALRGALRTPPWSVHLRRRLPFARADTRRRPECWCAAKSSFVTVTRFQAFRRWTASISAAARRPLST